MVTISEKTAQALRILELMFTRKDSVWSCLLLSCELGMSKDLIFERNRSMYNAGILRIFKGFSGGARIENDDVTIWDVACAVENKIAETPSEPWQHLTGFFERSMRRTRVIDLLKEKV